MQLFYSSEINETSKDILFDKEESKHIAKVLRKKEGDKLTITNGRGYFFYTELTFTNPKQCIAHIVSLKKQAPLPYQLHLAVAPTKLNDRYEWFLEKATEIGISEITPILCEHSERKVIKLERYKQKIKSAMKQSLHPYLPKLNPIQSYHDFLKNQHTNTDQKLIAHCEYSDKKSLKAIARPKERVIILIGPEGDFSALEINLAKDAGFIPVSLGTTRLRTETAAIVACHSIAFINEDL